jgi:hypothetical protein
MFVANAPYTDVKWMVPTGSCALTLFLQPGIAGEMDDGDTGVQSA